MRPAQLGGYDGAGELSCSLIPCRLSGVARAQVTQEADPLAVPARLSAAWRPSTMTLEELPPVFTGGWVGYTGYDTVRYVFPGARRPRRARAGPSRCLAALQGTGAVHKGRP